MQLTRDMILHRLLLYNASRQMKTLYQINTRDSR